MSTADALDRGRESFARRAWADAHARLSAADEETPLQPDDLQRLATAAYLAGADVDSADAWARAHQEHLARGDQRRGGAFWLAFQLLSKGQTARSGGWLARAQRLLDEGQHDCVERGYLLLPDALKSLASGDAGGAYDTFGRAAEIADRFDDPDLSTLARLGRGQALIRRGDVDEGATLLDEAMVAAEAGDLSPVVVGTVYCGVIETCQEIFDLRRAREWTEALTRWCEAQPQLVPYRGQCRVRRAEIMRLQGAWSDAMEEARRACERLSAPPGEPAAGLAYYQLAELHRLRGEFSEAEKAYGEASKWGRKPQPGLALLRLAQGQVDGAAAASRRLMDEARDRETLSRVLPAHVDIMLAAGDVEAARAGADELSEIAAALDAELLRARAARARGAVHIAEGDARSALDVLREAWAIFKELEARYEAADIRVLIGRACREMEDEDTAAMEFEAARWAFQRLGAAPDLARLDALTRPTAPGDSHGLTPREVEVLHLVASGSTNKSIATQLSISERTVERHLSNIFTKLGVSSRTAATAFAYEHGLV